MVALTEADAGKTVDLAVGKTVDIHLRENATAGYRWAVKSIDRSVCEIVADERIAPEKAIPGAPGEHRWRLRAGRKGESSLELVYSRPWESQAAPTRVFKLQLRVSAKD